MTYHQRQAEICDRHSILLPKGLRPVASLDAYRSLGGLHGLEKARQQSPQEIIETIRQAKLRGRGGAGFPTFIKWKGVREDPSPKKYLVCNGSEGEPGTYKDRYLLQKNPYWLIEGMLIAARAIGVEKVYLGLKAKFTRERKRFLFALKEFEAAGLVEPDFIRLVLGPDEYLFGEEKALLEVIDGRGAMPRIMPPYMKGIHTTPNDYNPTVVNNVETLSHVPNIIAKGADWFTAIGTEDTPGTTIFTLWGDVRFPGMYELPMGTTLRELLYEIGGGPLEGRKIKAVFSGVANGVMTSERFNTPMDFGSLKAVGGGLGSSGFMVYDDRHCMVRVAEVLSRFLAEESCGQCVPCKRGCGLITEHLKKIESGRGSADDLEAIEFECGGVTSQTRCFLPAEEQILVRSIVSTFKEEFERHWDGSCPFSSQPHQPQLPKLDDFDEQEGVFRLASVVAASV